MGLIPKFKSKSTEERRVEQEVRHHKARAVLRHYIDRLEKLQREVFGQGSQAAKAGDDKLVRRQAARFLILQERVKKGQKMLLLMEETRLQREIVQVSGDFINFAQDLSQSLLEGTDSDKMAVVPVELEKAGLQTEIIGEALTRTLDMAVEGILSSRDFSDKNVDEIARAMHGEAEAEEKSLDERISKGIKDVEDMMRQG